MTTETEKEQEPQSLRTINLISTARDEEVAPGLFIKRPLPIQNVGFTDPFLLLDHIGPKTVEPNDSNLVPDHPHRGFQPVTLVFSGFAEHKDSLGNHRVLHDGDVQWIHAGSGLIHSEKFGNDTDAPISFQAVQLWINLAAKDKMTPADYTHIKAEDIPNLNKDGITIRAISGQVFGIKGPANPFSDITILHLISDEGGTVTIPISEDNECLIYCLEGQAELNDEKPIAQFQVARTDKDGSAIKLKTEKNTRILILAGTAHNEPIANYGPFVMNTQDEIRQAILDFQMGNF